MGNKRSFQEEEDKIVRKIRKLERKLQRKREQTTSRSDEEIMESALPHLNSQPGSPFNDYEETLDRHNSMSLASNELDRQNLMPLADLELDRQVSMPLTLHNPVNPEPALMEPTVPVPGPSHKETPLEEDILQILGDAPQPDFILGKDIHKDVASRWQDTLSKGLTKELKNTLLKKYVIPANCSLLVAPILNPEAKAAVPEIVARKDNTLLQKQNQIGLALAALSQLTEMILKNEDSKQVLLQPLSDACRILCDSHFMETKTRRSLILSAINTGLRESLVLSNRDKFLFGEALAEKIKSTISVQRTGKSLQRTDPVTQSGKAYNSRYMPRGCAQNNLNSRGSIQRKPPIGESQRGRSTGRLTRGLTVARQPPPASKMQSPIRRHYRR